MEVPILIFHLNKVGTAYNTPLLLALLPVTLYDLFTVLTWKLHAYITLTHVALLNLLGLIFGLPQPISQNSESVLFPTDRYSFTILVLGLFLDIVVFAHLELFLKQNWVLKTSFQKSFKTAINIIDTDPDKMCLCDMKGHIVFANEVFISCFSTKLDDTKATKISAFFQKESKEKILKTLPKV